MRSPRRRPLVGSVVGMLTLAASACGLDLDSSPTPTPAPPSPTAAVTASAEPTATTSAVGSPSPTAEPPLSLPLPDGSDGRVVAASVAADLDDAGGTLTVTVTSTSDQRIDELVLRWPTELEATLRLAPFVPTDERISDGGPPLVQDWTKWVIGPGEQGEPEGTISLGYGPLLPGATLAIALDATRVSAGPVAFDLQVLAGNDLLALDGGRPAELRVEVP